MMEKMSSATSASTLIPAREAVDARFTWDLSSIFADWSEWEQSYQSLDRRIEAFRTYEGTLAQGPDRLLGALREQDELGQLAYKVWYFASLIYDQDQRDNTVNGHRQRVQMLIARWRQRSEEHTSELQSLAYLVCRLLLEKKKTI